MGAECIGLLFSLLLFCLFFTFLCGRIGVAIWPQLRTGIKISTPFSRFPFVLS